MDLLSTLTQHVLTHKPSIKGVNTYDGLLWATVCALTSGSIWSKRASQVYKVIQLHANCRVGVGDGEERAFQECSILAPKSGKAIHFLIQICLSFFLPLDIQFRFSVHCLRHKETR